MPDNVQSTVEYKQLDSRDATVEHAAYKVVTQNKSLPPSEEITLPASTIRQARRTVRKQGVGWNGQLVCEGNGVHAKGEAERCQIATLPLAERSVGRSQNDLLGRPTKRC